ncbi:MAG: CbiX/SirB N-terminal domain-containing protein [Clostridiales bacterium]|nr:CbiX/SirB N-terminal domain-containing protein [Clostridiales bacterium]
MDGILLLAHGSRAPQTQQTMEAIAAMVRRRLPERLIQVAYMELCEVNIEKGLSLLMEHGVTSVKVIPYFLFEGVHIQEDIPAELAAFQEKHPRVSITMGVPLGIDERLADIVAERINQKTEA